MSETELQQLLHTTIYNHTRSILDTTLKIEIATTFLIGIIYDAKLCSILFYEKDLEIITKEVYVFINKDNPGTPIETLDLTKLNNVDIECFNKVRDVLCEKLEFEGFYKSLYENDEYAVAVYEIGKTFKKENYGRNIDIYNICNTSTYNSTNC